MLALSASPPVRHYRSSGMADLDLSIMSDIDRAGLLAARRKQGEDLYADTDTKSTNAAFGAANGARTTALAQNLSVTGQDYVSGIWMLTHMIMFQPEYRPKFGEFVSTLGSGQPTGAVESNGSGMKKAVARDAAPVRRINMTICETQSQFQVDERGSCVLISHLRP